MPRNPRYAPEALESRLAPSGLGAADLSGPVVAMPACAEVSEYSPDAPEPNPNLPEVPEDPNLPPLPEPILPNGPI